MNFHSKMQYLLSCKIWFCCTSFRKVRGDRLRLVGAILFYLYLLYM